MNKLILIAMISSMLVGCNASIEDAPDKDKTWMKHGSDILTKVVEIEGHKYIILYGYCAGNIVHAESCNCKVK